MALPLILGGAALMFLLGGRRRPARTFTESEVFDDADGGVARTFTESEVFDDGDPVSIVEEGEREAVHADVEVDQVDEEVAPAGPPPPERAEVLPAKRVPPPASPEATPRKSKRATRRASQRKNADREAAAKQLTDDGPSIDEEREEARRAAALAAAQDEPSKPAPKAKPTDPSPPPAPPKHERAPVEPVAPEPDYPDGFDRDHAYRLAPLLAKEIQQKRYSTDKDHVREFQRAAGVTVDGLYGGGSAGALRHYLGGPPPRPLFKPTTEGAYPWPE